MKKGDNRRRCYAEPKPKSSMEHETETGWDGIELD